MSRKTFLSIVAVVASTIGLFTLLAPATFLAVVKVVTPTDTAVVMTRTVGILLVTMGLLNFMVRGHDDSPTLRSVLIANLVLQVGIAPIDPVAYLNGVFTTVGAFLPNTLLHIVLASGFVFYLARMKLPARAFAD